MGGGSKCAEGVAADHHKLGARPPPEVVGTPLLGQDTGKTVSQVRSTLWSRLRDLKTWRQKLVRHCFALLQITRSELKIGIQSFHGISKHVAFRASKASVKLVFGNLS
jgi:hypothetical protein